MTAIQKEPNVLQVMLSAFVCDNLLPRVVNRLSILICGWSYIERSGVVYTLPWSLKVRCIHNQTCCLYSVVFAFALLWVLRQLPLWQ